MRSSGGQNSFTRPVPHTSLALCAQLDVQKASVNLKTQPLPPPPPQLPEAHSPVPVNSRDLDMGLKWQGDEAGDVSQATLSPEFLIFILLIFRPIIFFPERDRMTPANERFQVTRSRLSTFP